MTSSEESEVIFRIDRFNTPYLHASEPNEDEEEVNNEEPTTILCSIFKSGKIGVAYFNIQEQILYVYDEIVEWGPDFYYTKSLYKELRPQFLVSFGNLNEQYTKFLIDLMLDVDNNTSTNSLRSIPPNLFLVKAKEYSFDICRYVLTQLEIGSDVDPNRKELDKEFYINSLINFDNKLSVYAAGILVKYLDKNWAYFSRERSQLQILHVESKSVKGHLLMDLTTFNALQIFHQCAHEASFKRGAQSSSREGLSIYKIFLSLCKSRMGQQKLKDLLLKPTNDIGELTKRLDFLSFALHPSHQEFIESVQDNVKMLRDISYVFRKIQHSRANFNDWKLLYETIYRSIFVSELSEPFRERSAYLAELQDSISSDLLQLEDSMSHALDFTTKSNTRRPTIKLGLDESLDAKKLQRNDITKRVTAAAEVAVAQLPDYITQCSIVYLPEMGHLIAIPEWGPYSNPEDLLPYGLNFMFPLRGSLHFKNAICVELDENLGDLNGAIIAHEIRILQRLSSFVIKFNKSIREPLRILAMLDALIAIAKVSSRNNYVRPMLNNQNIHEIQMCRHPLLELSSNVTSNDFYSGGSSSHIKIITGPNGSGKSIYLKQIALTIFLAHIGSYVPAKSANIAVMHSIHTRLQTTESASVRLSGFMIDSIQTTQAIRNARADSLVLLDEFGRGTNNESGLAFLVSALKKFHGKGASCPHVILASHQQQVAEFLPGDELVEYWRMKYADADDGVTFLYAMEKGIANSFALKIAEAMGIDADIIARGKELMAKKKIEQIDGGRRALVDDVSVDALLEQVGFYCK